MTELIVLLPILYIAIIAIPLAITDFQRHRLPNPMTVSAMAVTVLCLLAIGFISSSWLKPLTGLLAGVLTFWIGLLLANRAALGMGDVKLLCSLNAVAGYFSPMLAVVSVTAGLVLATLASLVLYFFGRISLKSSLPLGPYLLFGFFVCVGPPALFLTAEVLS